MRPRTTRSKPSSLARQAKGVADDVAAVRDNPVYTGSALLGSLTTAVQLLAEAVVLIATKQEEPES